VRILYTGGGTGGHVTPNLALHGELSRRHPDAKHLYVGLRGKAEAVLAPQVGIPMRTVRARPWPGLRNLPALLGFLVSLLVGTTKAAWIVATWRPDLVIATGGYGAAPVVLATAVLRRMRIVRTRIFIHESNVALGRMNAVAARLADRVGVAFPETLPRLPRSNGAVVGYPVRPRAVQGNRDDARRQLGLPADARVVFAFGGSQGARTLNRAVVDALPRLLADPDVWVIHGTGKHLAGNRYDGARDTAARLAALPPLDDAARRYLAADFFNDIGTQYAAADLAICRAGAGTLNEVCAAGLPAIVIPKANLPGDHQVGNARSLARAGAAVVLYEGVDLAGGDDAVESVEGEALAGEALALLHDPERLAGMSRRAAALHDPGVLGRIADHADALLAGSPLPPDAPGERSDDTGDRILGLDSAGLERLLVQVRQGGSLDPDEVRLVHYKIDGFLAEKDFVLRARGCRMAGLAGHVQRRAVLVAFAAGRRADGRRREAPIVRRDAFVGLRHLGDPDPAVLDALVAGIDDPYYEARRAAIDALAGLAKAASDNAPFARFETALAARLTDRSFEVRAAAVEALGVLATDAEALVRQFRRLRFDRIWIVRASIYRALECLVRRGVLSPSRAREEMRQVLLTSVGNRPRYPLKEAARRLSETIREAQARSGD
jgi:UDP-N-acetylglucosamine--N-acetylmuramyl-(pentapeptide) pyrophosphoryl-undecaprenol N-acetylglucosamine transferase